MWADVEQIDRMKEFQVELLKLLEARSNFATIFSSWPAQEKG
jgi:hypothetical protein